MTKLLFHICLFYILKSVSAIQKVGYGHEYPLKVDNLSCNPNEIQNIPAIKHIDQLLEKLWHELDKDVKDAKSSVISDRYDTNIQEYKTMAFILTGALGVTHSLNLAIDRAGRTRWKPVRDISRSIGVPMYSFSFSIGRFRKVKPLKLGCGTKDLNVIKWKFNHLNGLQEFSEKVENINSYSTHPLIQLGPNLLPEIVEHDLNKFKFRLTSSLGCLLEDNNKDANTMARHINTLVSTSKQKLRLINASLQQKISAYENNLPYNQNLCF